MSDLRYFPISLFVGKFFKSGRKAEQIFNHKFELFLQKWHGQFVSHVDFPFYRARNLTDLFSEGKRWKLKNWKFIISIEKRKKNDRKQIENFPFGRKHRRPDHPSNFRSFNKRTEDEFWLNRGVYPCSWKHISRFLKHQEREEILMKWIFEPRKDAGFRTKLRAFPSFWVVCSRKTKADW